MVRQTGGQLDKQGANGQTETGGQLDIWMGGLLQTDTHSDRTTS